MPRSPQQLRRFGSVVLPLALIGCGQAGTTPSTTPTTTPSATPSAVSSATTAVASAYKDGQFSSTGLYVSPAGGEMIDVKVTLKDGIVTDVSVTPKATHEISLKMQKTVADNVGPLVVGKPLGEVQLDKVSGSSLTPKGFNDALVKIKAMAAVTVSAPASAVSSPAA